MARMISDKGGASTSVGNSRAISAARFSNSFFLPHLINQETLKREIMEEKKGFEEDGLFAVHFDIGLLTILVTITHLHAVLTIFTS